ncbi:efflux RND transporter permease subunit [Taibaiella koreensis]|uniref:efflux RND transporter permease subunit n=1 Tax=Taibaiella koreensis TaxID=1268548 RepID=UPI000E59BA8A|nr:efflux RND transporter permease subunit [Taibaiella koreensis]
MWHRIADFVLRFRILLLVLLFAVTGVMGYYASKVELSYDFTNAIPTDNPKYQDYQRFRNMFGEDGNTMMVGVQTADLFKPEIFMDYVALSRDIGKVKSVENVLGIPAAVTLVQDSVKKLNVLRIFPDNPDPAAIDSLEGLFKSLPFYKGLLYNDKTNAYVMAIRINKQTLASKDRTRVINEIIALGDAFGKKHRLEVHYSGLPHIRTQMANKVQHELRVFLMLSFALTAVILLIFFRSILAVLTSMIVVAIGVIWSFGTLALLGYKITILTGVIPPLVVVIGIPNCVYFLNKYHTEYAQLNSKIPSLRNMVGKMGIVTLFTNLTAAIGFGVFFFTKSVILKEFGLVSGINILGLFFISLVFIPAVYSFLPAPNTRHTSYLESKWMNKLLDSLSTLVFHNRRLLYLFTIAICGVSVIGMLRLKAVGHIVDDLPHSDKIYTDLKFFEKNFKGVMPLEIIVDTKKKFGALGSLETWEKLDSLTNMLESRPEIGGGLTLIKGIKFARQGFSGGAVEEYRLPDQFEFSALKPYLVSMLRKRDNNNPNPMSKLLNSFVDTNIQNVRISVNVADIGSVEMPKLLDKIKPQAEQLFDTAQYKLTFTGTSITFLEGSKFIINSLRDSLIWAFAMILVCMIVLFRNWRIVLIAVVTNIVPLLITAGIMGWLNVPLKPSTVLVFSVALGITVDVTIRFLVNFKQELATHNEDIEQTVRRSIHDTGLSIIFTSLILMAGFAVFAVSEFDGTKSLGYLTSLTLFLAMIFNLTLQPALLLWMDKAKKKKGDIRGKKTL